MRVRTHTPSLPGPGLSLHRWAPGLQPAGQACPRPLEEGRGGRRFARAPRVGAVASQWRAARGGEAAETPERGRRAWRDPSCSSPPSPPRGSPPVRLRSNGSHCFPAACQQLSGACTPSRTGPGEACGRPSQTGGFQRRRAVGEAGGPRAEVSQLSPCPTRVRGRACVSWDRRSRARVRAPPAPQHPH